MDKTKIDIVKSALINNGVNCENINFKILNLLKDEGWDDALKGCEYVLHMASPVIPGDVDEDLFLLLPTSTYLCEGS